LRKIAFDNVNLITDWPSQSVLRKKKPELLKWFSKIPVS